MFSLTNVLLGMLLTGMWVVAACTARAGCTSLRVAKPGLTGAMVLTLVAAGGSIAAQFAMGMMTGMSMFGHAMQAHAEQIRMLLALPVWMLVCSVVYKSMLPTTFGKAMIIFVLQAAIIGAMMLGFSLLANFTHSQALLQVRSMLPM
jgi:hypothetical protein